MIYDPVILEISEHLRVQLPLGDVELGAEPVPKVCSDLKETSDLLSALLSFDSPDLF